MRNERTPGATFAPDKIGWIDFESRGHVPIEAGTDRYSRNAQAIMLAWAIGDGPVRTEVVADFNQPLRWADMPHDLKEFYAHVERGDDVVFCAHNATFDRSVWNHATIGFPKLSPYMLIDTRAQATASGLPASLDNATRYVGAAVRKDKAGKELIKLFTVPGAIATPQSHPEAWQAFIEYAARDVGAMRSLFKMTRQLPLAEWREFWAAEVINDYGVHIDLPLVTAATAMAAIDQRLAGVELARLTGDVVTTVNQVDRMINWLIKRLPSDGVEILTKSEEEIDLETGELLKPKRNSLDRNRLVRLLAYLDAQEPLPAPLQAAQRLLQIRKYGGSKTPAKFGKMLSSQVDGVIRGQYVFNGASQTGRFSARGIQIHNLLRESCSYEIDAVDALCAGATPEEFAVLGDDQPISRKLSMLIRPSLVPAPGTGNVFCWSDWSNIEARITPWLSNDPDALKRLEVFAAVDADPRIPDVYTRTAATLSNLPIEAIDKKLRQRGKVVELACSFGGGTNALLAMAASYGMHLETSDAKAAVERWRDANRWAPRFWGRHDERGSYGLWGAANKAMERAGQVVEAGRVSFIYLSKYLGGSLLCRLPSGRFLTYRRIKWELVEEVDEDTKEVISRKYELMFSRDMGRIKLWPGLFAENVTQAAAADILRGTLVRLGHEKFKSIMVTRIHTHDEILAETKEKDAHLAAEILRTEMERGFEWTFGLPIAAESSIGRWYTKNEASLGL